MEVAGATVVVAVVIAAVVTAVVVKVVHVVEEVAVVVVITSAGEMVVVGRHSGGCHVHSCSFTNEFMTHSQHVQSTRKLDGTVPA